MPLHSCHVEEWRRRTADNTRNRRLIIIDPWRGTGLGHVILGLGNAIALALQSNRSLRFAACAPRRLATSFAPSMPACEDESHFDILDYVHFEGVPSLQATPSDWKGLRITSVVRGQQQLFRRPSCEQLKLSVLISPEVVVWVHLPTQSAIKCATLGPSHRIGSLGVASACARRIRPRERLPPLPPCTVGLHLRSLALDDRGCNLLMSPHSGLAGAEPRQCRLREAGQRRQYARRAGHPRCRSVSFPQSITPPTASSADETKLACATHPGRVGEGGSTSALFATADDPALYAKHTRPLGWRDLGERAVRTWLLHNASERASAASTIAAWVGLTRCTRAIVAPVPSKFSDSAALVAGVPLLRCCQQPWASTTAMRQPWTLWSSSSVLT
jgi:hypothetical protein